MKKIIFSFSPILICFCVSAQKAIFAPMVGFNASNMALDNESITNRPRFGVKAGTIIDIAISKHLHLQPGAFYVKNGTKIDFLNIHEAGAFKVNSVELPVNITYKTGKPNEGSFFFSAGPYLGINLWGTVTIPVLDFSGSYVGSEDFPMTLGKAGSDLPRIDFGVNMNTGYEFKHGFLARAYYQRGILPSPIVYCYNYGVAVGYFIGQKAKHEQKKTNQSPTTE